MKEYALLTHPESSNLPLPTSRDLSPECPTVKAWVKVHEAPIDVVPPFNMSMKIKVVHICQTLFKGHPDGEGTNVDEDQNGRKCRGASLLTIRDPKLSNIQYLGTRKFRHPRRFSQDDKSVCRTH